MTLYAIIGGAFVLAAFLFWLLYKLGKGAGATQHEADSATAGLAVEKRMTQAGADAPSDLKSVADAARRGEF